MPRLVAALWLASCGHPSQVGATSQQGPEAVQPPGQPPVATGPGGILSRGAIVSLQRALGERGIHVEASGALDDQTQAAIRTFQHREGLAETGLPDMDTLRLLGLNAAEIYATPSPGAEQRTSPQTLPSAPGEQSPEQEKQKGNQGLQESPEDQGGRGQNSQRQDGQRQDNHNQQQ